MLRNFEQIFLQLMSGFFFLFLCIEGQSCNSDNEEEPKVVFSINMEDITLETVLANEFSVSIKPTISNIRPSNLGIVLFKNGSEIDSYSESYRSNYIYHCFSNLEPCTEYEIKGFVTFLNPNTHKSETFFGNSLKISTQDYKITLNKPTLSVYPGNIIVYSYSSGTCQANITSNYSKIDQFGLLISTDKDFIDIIDDKKYSCSSSYSKESFTIPYQGKFYCRAYTQKEGKPLVSNTIEYLVIMETGTVIEEGMVDLGLDVLWNANYYTEFVNGKEKKFFPVSTISNFNEIVLTNKEGNNVKNFSGSKYDYITDKMGAPYRTPTIGDYELLLHACKWEITDAYYIVSGCTGNAIKMPYKFDDSYYFYYGTSSVFTDYFCWSFQAKVDGLSMTPYQHFTNGFIIYPVADKK